MTTLADRLRAGLVALANLPYPDADGVLNAVKVFAYGDRTLSAEEYVEVGKVFDDLVAAEAALHQMDGGGMWPPGLWDDDDEPVNPRAKAEEILGKQRDQALDILCGSRVDGPPRIGDRVTSNGGGTGTVVEMNSDGTLRVWVIGENACWRFAPESLRVVARAEYTQATP